jgi:hypothetical protein
MFQVLIHEQPPKTFLMQSKSQDQEVDYAEPDACVEGEDHVATQLFVSLHK